MEFINQECDEASDCSSSHAEDFKHVQEISHLSDFIDDDDADFQIDDVYINPEMHKHNHPVSDDGNVHSDCLACNSEIGKLFNSTISRRERPKQPSPIRNENIFYTFVPLPISNISKELRNNM